MFSVRKGKIMTERRCKQIFAMLSDFLDGELPAKNCRQMERHLKGCPPCIAYIESLKATVEACHRYRVPRAPALSKKVKAALLAGAQPAREKT
jgi:RNA polymerase sigma-70 factor (ECF subfamily)